MYSDLQAYEYKPAEIIQEQQQRVACIHALTMVQYLSGGDQYGNKGCYIGTENQKRIISG